MLNLSDIDEWKKLETPFRNSENLPDLIEKLAQTFDKELLAEIASEYIYHQGSLYDSTFAVFPHLIRICEASNDPDFRLDTLLNLAVDLAEYHGDSELEEILKHSKCNPETIKDINNSFKESFKRLKPIAESLMEFVAGKEEFEKKYFLLALAVANGIFPVSTILWRYNDNEEYECCCPECDEDLLLWNEDGKLSLYKEDPVFEKHQTKYLVHPASISKAGYSKEILPGKNYEWLSYYIDKLNIKSFKATINYLFGSTTCPYCKTDFKIFENIPVD